MSCPSVHSPSLMLSSNGPSAILRPFFAYKDHMPTLLPNWYAPVCDRSKDPSASV